MATVNMTNDKLFFSASHTNLGDISDNGNLVNIISEPLSDTSEVRDPGVGGDRVRVTKADKGRKISVEVATGSTLERYLRRCMRYRNTDFTCLWADERVGGNEQEGQGTECRVKPATANDRGAETVTFEIESLNYTGD